MREDFKPYLTEINVTKVHRCYVRAIKNKAVNRRLMQTIVFRLPDLVDPGTDISMDSIFLVVEYNVPFSVVAHYMAHCTHTTA
jgi:hypothetical protein